ncbi:hypothetical protein ACFC4G_48715 [Streptomyces sp. NPDC056002]|uniref:hypothetical protein n=1 Tax=Streptomyces sp. NPDC056002 TaxID=3345675 RepID=UPI0035D9C518
MAVWQRIVAAIKRDPYGRTARQVEEVLQTARPYGVSKALSEVLVRTREHLEATERAEVAHQIQAMLRRSELQAPEFASRIGVSNESFADYLEGTVSPPASLLLRMQRLSDRATSPVGPPILSGSAAGSRCRPAIARRTCSAQPAVP